MWDIVLDVRREQRFIIIHLVLLENGVVRGSKKISRMMSTSPY